MPDKNTFAKDFIEFLLCHKNIIENVEFEVKPYISNEDIYIKEKPMFSFSIGGIEVSGFGLSGVNICFFIDNKYFEYDGNRSATDIFSMIENIYMEKIKQDNAERENSVIKSCYEKMARTVCRT